METKQKKNPDKSGIPSVQTVSQKKNKQRKKKTANPEKIVAGKIKQEFRDNRDSFNRPFGWRWIWMMGWY